MQRGRGLLTKLHAFSNWAGGETWKLGLDDAVTSAQQHSRDTPRKATLPKNFLGNAVSLHRSFIELPVKYYIGNWM